MEATQEILVRGVENIYPSKEELEKVLRSGKKIRVYQGFDPSMPNLHLGNYVGLLKLKEFQDLGHEVIFLVGDFTGMIGDPTDKSATRTRLSREQTQKNANNWKEQASRILSFDGANPAKMLFNSAWLDEISFIELMAITSHFTVPQLLERDFFQERIREDKTIYLHEFLYPVAQAIDSVKMDVDLEIGGNDQTFNMLAGRDLMKAMKGKEKFVLSTKLLVDAQGNKVGKTTGNAIFLNMSANEMFGAIMSFPDEVIPLGFELLTLVPLEKIEENKENLTKGEANPMEMKKQLAYEVVKINYGEKLAKEAQEEFERVFQKHEVPEEEILVHKVKPGAVNVIDLLVDSKLAPSRSEAKRLIEQGAVDIDEETITNYQLPITVREGMVIKAGKRRFVKIRVNQ